MKRSLIAGILAAAAVCGCGRGRTAQQETVPAATDNATAGNVERAMTIAGCLVPASATRQNSDADAPSGPPPPTFTLVDVATPVAASGATGTTGTAGSGAPGSYDLVADKDRLDDLQRFANSRVEITGSVVAPGDVRRLHVKDVRQLESKCAAVKKD